MATSGHNNYTLPPQAEPSYDRSNSDRAHYPQVYQGEQGQPGQEHDLKYGTSVMGVPSAPDAHPDNQSAATGSFSSHSSASFNQSTPAPSVAGQTADSPYVQTTPSTPAGKGTMDNMKAQMQQFSKKAELQFNNMWGHLSTGGSEADSSWKKVAENAWGRVTAGTQLLTKGGFEGVFKSTFPSNDVNEKLLKTYACFLSTSTGPVAGTLYISSKRLAFCSDRPLKYLPTGKTEPAFSYYKVIVPREKVKSVTPSANQKKPAEKYIQVSTHDNFDFWFMGFVNYDKGVKNLQMVMNGNNPAAALSQQQSFDSHPPPYTESTYTPNEQYQQQSYPPNEQYQQQTYPPNEQDTFSNNQAPNYPSNYPPNVPSENYRRPSMSPNMYGTRPS